MAHEFPDPPEVDTPLGTGRAILLSLDIHDNYWTVVLDDSLAVVDFRQSQIRWGRNYTAGQGISDKQMRKIINANRDTRRVVIKAGKRSSRRKS